MPLRNEKNVVISFDLRIVKVSRYLCKFIYVKLLLLVNLEMTDHCTTDFCIWPTICLVPLGCISSICHMYTMDFAYDGPIFLVPLSLSYLSSPVLSSGTMQVWFRLLFVKMASINDYII